MPPKSMLAENDMWDPYIVPYVVTIDELGHGDGEQDAVEGVAGGGHAGKESCRPCTGSCDGSGPFYV